MSDMTERPSAERQELIRLLNAAMHEGERVGQGYVGDYPKAMAPILAAFDAVTRELAEARKALDWITDRVRDAHGPVGFSVNEDGDILVMSWSAEGLRGDAGETAADAIAAAFGDG